MPRAWDQRHALQAGLDWKNDGWELSLAGHIRSGWPTTALTIETRELPGEEPRLVAERLGYFASLDARLARKYDLPRGRLTLFAEISNLLNRKNVCCIDYDLETDDDGNEVLEQSADYWLPLLPAIGFLWEF